MFVLQVMQFGMVAAMVVANVANVFAINPGVPEEELGRNDPATWRDNSTNFVLVSCIASAGAVVLLMILFSYLRYKRLLLW